MPTANRTIYTCTFGLFNQSGGWTDTRSMSWPELAMLLTTHEVGKKEGTCLVPAVFSSTKRVKADAKRIDVVFLDSDSGHPLQHIQAAVARRGWAAVISSSHSHLTTRTKARRGNWDKFRTTTDADGDAADLPARFLIEEKGYLPAVADDAWVAEEKDEFTFFEHQPCPKFRVALPLLRPWLANSYDNQRTANAAWQERIEALAAALGLSHDQACTDTSRLFYLPRRPADGPPADMAILEGEPCDIFAVPAAEQRVRTRPTRGKANAKAEKARLRQDAIEFVDPHTGQVVDLTRWVIQRGRVFQLASALASRRPDVFVPRSGEAPKRHVRCVNEDSHTQAGADAATFVVDASDSTSKSGFVYHCRHGHCDGRDRLLFLKQMLQQEWLSVGDLTDPQFLSDEDGTDGELTEHSVALRFAKLNIDRLRHCHTAGAWYTWGGSHWARNETRLAFHWARKFTAALNKDAELKVRVATGKAAFAGAVERFAAADESLAVTSAVWDCDPWLLGTPDGVVDLRTGLLRPADRQDMMTKVTVVAPAPTTSCPHWLAFLNDATGGDQDLIGFLQRWFGYCLTGVTHEHALLFVYGPGGNGKGVLLVTIAGILDAYATTAAMDTFTASQGDRHPTDLAMLRGARMVLTTETEEGRVWAEARIKALTGGDPITARFMRRDFFTFTPAFKLTISGNHKPALRNVDDAARRRFNVVPFVHKPTRPDPNLPEKLKAEWPGILRWMIEGCLAWQRVGLARPRAVLDATAEYFAEQDVLAQWVEECCEQGRSLGATSAELFGSWRAFATSRAEEPRNAKWFATMLERQGFQRAKDCQLFRGRGFLGLRPRPETPVRHWQDRD